MQPVADAAEHRTMIVPRVGFAGLNLGELWQRRDLLFLLALRDIKVRYKQTALGASWAVIQPVVAMVVLHLFFGRVMGMANRTGDVPYPIFLYAGLLPWQLFSSAVNASSNSLVTNASILKKVYFPRLLIPLASLGPPLLDYVIASVVLVGMMIWFGIAVTWSVLLLPFLVLSTLIAVLGVGVLLSSLTVSFRDIRHAVPFIIQMLMFMTPVIYPVTMLPGVWRWILSLNPMFGTISAFRGAILGTPIDYAAWAVSTVVGLVMLGIGLMWFARVERKFADIA